MVNAGLSAIIQVCVPIIWVDQLLNQDNGMINQYFLFIAHQASHTLLLGLELW